MVNVDVTEIVKEISTDLARKLKGEGENVNPNSLNIIVKTVIKELIQKREYPESWSEEEILADINNYYATIVRVSEYDYNMIGAEGEETHNENGVNRKYVDRDKYFGDVYKFVRVLV